MNRRRLLFAWTCGSYFLAGCANDNRVLHSSSIVVCVPAASMPSDGAPTARNVLCAPERSDSSKQVRILGLSPRLLRDLRSSRLATADFATAFVVTVEPASTSRPVALSAPPVIGSYDVVDGELRFAPQFSFGDGVNFRVDLDVEKLSRIVGLEVSAQAPLVVRFSTPRQMRHRTTKVVAVYPNATRLPENLLRWYIEFSAPMQTGDALEHIHLVDAAGRDVHNVFLKSGQELWDSSRTRLTLLLDPGRIKRGIRSNTEMGSPLVAGRRYRLVVDSHWTDGAGAALYSAYTLEFLAGPADRSSPAPESWQLLEPAAGSVDALVVRFGEPMDHALASRLLQTTDASGGPVPGQSELSQGDSVWTFVPTRPWGAQVHMLQVLTELEDVAGNSVARQFDSELLQLSTPQAPGGAGRGTFRRQFRPRAAVVQKDSKYLQ